MMKHDITRQQSDPVLAPDQFSVVQPLITSPDWSSMEWVHKVTKEWVKVSLILC